MWDFLAEEVGPFVTVAVRVWGAEVPAAENADRPAAFDRKAAGRELLRLFFGAQHGQLPTPLADLIADPDSDRALTGLVEYIEEALEDDPGLTASAVEIITGYYRGQADAGDIQALVDLGDILYWDEPEAARAAYQQAVDAGDRQALLNLAKVLHVVIEDDDAALAVYRQAIGSGDAGLAAEAMIELAHMQLGRDDEPAPRAAYQQAIDSHHPDWAPAAMIGLAQMEVARRDASAARAAYLRAIDTGHPAWAPTAMVRLADLHVRLDDLGPAQALFQRAIGAGSPDLSARASLALSRLRKNNGDLKGAKAAWRRVIDSPDGDKPSIAVADHGHGRLGGLGAPESQRQATMTPLRKTGVLTGTPQAVQWLRGSGHGGRHQAGLSARRASTRNRACSQRAILASARLASARLRTSCGSPDPMALAWTS